MCGHKNKTGIYKGQLSTRGNDLEKPKPLSYSISFKSILISSFYWHLRPQTDLFVLYKIQIVFKIQVTEDTEGTQGTESTQDQATQDIDSIQDR